MPRKALFCVLELDVRLITCPGVLLKDKEELYLSVSILGQYKKTQYVPAAFPLLFQEKLVFEKAFPDIVDPGDLVKLLEFDTAVLELIQLIPPGKILATYEENTRDFLFPDPKLTRGHHGLDREILMKRSSSFPGIAPKLRFSTSSLITERLLSSEKSHIQGDLNCVQHSTPNGKLQTKLPKKNTLSPEKSRHSVATKNYERPTIASKSRSPSPYTRRRMCELSEEARQRLAHLNLGPYEYRRETDKPPFVVRRKAHRMCRGRDGIVLALSYDSMICLQLWILVTAIEVEQPSPGINFHTWCPTRESAAEGWTKVDCDPSLLGSYRPKKAKAESTHGKYFDSSGVCSEDMILELPNRQSCSAASLEHSALRAFQKHSLSSVLNRSSLRESAKSGSQSLENREMKMHNLDLVPCYLCNQTVFSSGWPSPPNGDEIHKRVKNILRTHSARQRLIFDESNSSKGDLRKTREFLHKAPLSMSELQSSSPVQQNRTVHSDNGDCWSSRAAVYKGKPHRAIFEESHEKRYRNMY